MLPLDYIADLGLQKAMILG